MEVNVQLQAPATLPHEKNPRCLLERRSGGAKSRCGRYEEEKNIFPLPRTEPRSLCRLREVSVAIRNGPTSFVTICSTDFRSNELPGTKCILRRQQPVSCWDPLQHSKETKGSLTCPQKPATGPYPEPGESSLHNSFPFLYLNINLSRTSRSLKNAVFWDVELCGFIINRHFGGMSTDRTDCLQSVSNRLTLILFISSTLKM
jgi:hypothetical protein